MSKEILCFDCQKKPAGCKEQPYSAYCETCDKVHQARARERSLPAGRSICGCGICGRIFLNTTAFDRHRARDQNSGAPTGVCLDPSSYGHVQGDNGAWGTRAGHDQRKAFGLRAASHREEKSRADG